MYVYKKHIIYQHAFQPFRGSFYILWQNSVGSVHFWARFLGTIKLVGVKITTRRWYGVWWRNKRPDFPLTSPTIEFIVRFTPSTASSTLSQYHFPVPLQIGQRHFSATTFFVSFFYLTNIFITGRPLSWSYRNPVKCHWC